jgi:S-adenosylmethionine synthetase
MAIMTGSARNIIIQEKSGSRHEDRRVEMCEHKGIGHPDSIMDGACEAAACALAVAYQKVCGRVLHFNVDKGLLVAGKSATRFGGGVIEEPAKLIVCGRATDAGNTFNVNGLVRSAVDDFLRRSLRADPHLFRVISEVKPGSASLTSIFASEKGAPVANDTSFGIGFAPYSMLEQRILQISAMLRSQAFRLRFPAAGDDFKVMGLREEGEYRFTIALAMIDRHVRSVADYFGIKRDMAVALSDALPSGCQVNLNALDDPGADHEPGLHLTVTGLSAEMGDDGQVGRGNRVSSLITPDRPMSLEAAAGKNPFSHVGKIYNVLAQMLANEIVTKVDTVEEVEVQLLSTIGQPVDRPQVALINVRSAGGATALLRKEVEQIVNYRFDRIDDLMSRLAHGLVDVY